MDYDWAEECGVRFGGAEGALTICLGLGPTGALISREIRIKCGPLDGRVRAWFDFDLDAVRRELRSLLARHDLTGHVRLTGAEHGEFRAMLDLDHGRGVISAAVKSPFARMDGGGTFTLTTDQSYLRETLRALEQLPA